MVSTTFFTMCSLLHVFYFGIFLLSPPISFALFYIAPALLRRALASQLFAANKKALWWRYFTMLRLNVCYWKLSTKKEFMCVCVCTWICVGIAFQRNCIEKRDRHKLNTIFSFFFFFWLDRTMLLTNHYIASSASCYPYIAVPTGQTVDHMNNNRCFTLTFYCSLTRCQVITLSIFLLVSLPSLFFFSLPISLPLSLSLRCPL